MSKVDLNQIPDGGILRTLDSRLHVVRRRKHEWSAVLNEASPKKLKLLTNKVWGSKFFESLSLEFLVDRIEAAGNAGVWSRTYQVPHPLDIANEIPVGVADGHRVSTIRIVCDGLYIHAYRSRIAMEDDIVFPVDAEDRLYDPPLVDSVYFTAERRGFAVTIVPSEGASSQQTVCVFIGEATPDFPRVHTFWTRINELLSTHGKIERIVHAGGGSFTLHFVDGSSSPLAGFNASVDVMEVEDRLKQIADAAEIAFLDRSYPAVSRQVS